MKSFLRQIRYEIKNIIKSKFLLIIGILLIAASIAFPVIDLLAGRKTQGGGGIVRPMPIYDIMKSKDIGIPIYPGTDQGSITVNGVTIDSTNPFFWQLQSLVNEKQYMETDTQRFSTAEAMDLALLLLDEEINYYLNFAKSITNYMDYRYDLAFRSMDPLYDMFIFRNVDKQSEVLWEAVSTRKYMELEYLQSNYVNLTAEEKISRLEKSEEELNSVYNIVETNDFQQYVDLRIQQEQKTIENIKEQIAIQEQEIIKNPDQEEIINQMIVELKRNIRQIEENTIPVLLLRKEKNIVPGDDTWQNRALNDIEMYKNQLTYTEILNEETFNQNQWLVQQYGTYQKYVDAMQKQIDEMNNAIIIAEKSVNADKPDMRFVYNGSRNKTVQFLNYSVFITLFAVLVGGWLMASEFQQGTIRLLMIRPKTRLKILSAKFLSALIICLIVYAAGSLLNIVANGFCHGFADYAFPNYTIAGEIGFFAYFLPKMLACTVPIIFGYSIAFLLSVLVRNVAVAIAIPIAGHIGSLIFMATMAYRSGLEWLTYTPIPYLQLATYFTQSSTPQIYGNSVTMNLTYGIILLLGLSAACVAAASIVFHKRDITN